MWTVETSDRPKRRAIPHAVRRIVAARQNYACGCGCGLPIVPGGSIEWDHSPSLRLREIAPDGLDYLPAQHDPDHIVARCKASHSRKTRGTGATTAGTDIGAIKKLRKRERGPKPKRKWQSRGFDKSLRKRMDGSVTKR